MILIGIIMLGRLTGFSIFWLYLAPLVRFFSIVFAGHPVM